MAVKTLESNQWKEDGCLLLPGFVDENVVAAARAEIPTIFPTASAYSANPEAYLALSRSEFSAMRSFPFDAPALNNLCLFEPLLDVVEELLRTREILLYQAQLWGKYQGAASYNQTLHRDYAKNTMLGPLFRKEPDFLGVFLFLEDITDGQGPTMVVPGRYTKALPLEPARLSPSDDDLLYTREIPAVGPAGSALIYHGSIFHRASELSAPGGSRFTLKLAFKKRWATWVGYHAGIRLGFEPEWSVFVRAASRRQLETIGFPPRNDSRWSDPELLDELSLRYQRDQW